MITRGWFKREQFSVHSQINKTNVTPKICMHRLVNKAFFLLLCLFLLMKTTSGLILLWMTAIIGPVYIDRVLKISSLRVN